VLIHTSMLVESVWRDVWKLGTRLRVSPTEPRMPRTWRTHVADASRGCHGAGLLETRRDASQDAPHIVY
jgi:hypothetical protein